MVAVPAGVTGMSFETKQSMNPHHTRTRLYILAALVLVGTFIYTVTFTAGH